MNGDAGTVSLDNGRPGAPQNYDLTRTVSAGVLVLIFISAWLRTAPPPRHISHAAAVQAMGSQAIGMTYAPIMGAWLLFIGITGAQRIAAFGASAAFSAWNPFWLRHFWTSGRFRGAASWRALGGTVLSVTGAEALFADLVRAFFVFSIYSVDFPVPRATLDSQPSHFPGGALSTPCSCLPTPVNLHSSSPWAI